jgi:predicted transcriptional regulator
LQVCDQSKAEEVAKALSDKYSRKIIFAIVARAEPIEEISKGQDIPISTCYRRIHELMAAGIVRPEKTIIQDDGKKFVCYKSTFKNATINLGVDELTVDVVLNRDKPMQEEPQKRPANGAPLIRT